MPIASVAGKSTLERHLQSLLLALLTGVCGWLGFTVQDSTVKIAQLAEKVIYLQEQVSSGTVDRYHAADAARDFALRDDQIRDLRARVDRLESKGR